MPQDEPPVLLGKGIAANPVEHLLHALASRLTTSMAYHAAARGIHIEEVESYLEGDLDLQGFLELDRNVGPRHQGMRVNFKIKADVPERTTPGDSPTWPETLPGIRLHH
jgi:uncharacterized OsmC-like protein